MEKLAPTFTLDLQERMPLDVVVIRNHGCTAPHSHRFSELVIVRQGTATHVSPGGEYPIGAGDVFVLHGDQVHGYRDSKSLELVNILFRMDELRLTLQDIETVSGYHMLFALEPAFRDRDRFESRLRLSPEQREIVDTRLRQLIGEREMEAPGWRFAMIAQFMLIVCDLCRFYSELETPLAQPLMRMGDVVSYIHQHLSDQITIDDLARIGCMSRRTLTREFTRVTGHAPIEYLIRERVKRAREMLLSTDRSVTEVAYAVGFQDSNYFSRKFRETMGVSPRAVRLGERESGQGIVMRSPVIRTVMVTDAHDRP